MDDLRDRASEFIQRAYDRQSEREWQRMDRHRTEFALTLRAMERHLPPPPARILDCGGGPGRYAIELAGQGYQVVLFDLSAGNLDMAREKAAAAGMALQGYEQGTALDLSRFSDDAFDAVLLMGPLYHLLEEHERRRALEESCRVLRPGGPLLAAFVTRYASLRYAAAYDPTWILERPEETERILSTGVLPPREGSESQFIAYFAHPSEVEPLCREAGLEVEAVLGMEGLVSMREEGVNELEGEAWQAWVELNERVSADPYILGGVEHLLVVAHKPRWRAVLRRIARALDEAGVAYKVVGGTCPALHGVPLPVRDVDLETDARGAYFFQERFAAQARRPVALSASETYRSHFGLFDFDGVPVEVMGDLERREGDRWVPTMASTEAVVDLEGVPVRTAWLEEEVLAYVRRGRLERAGLCLPYCDHGRLLSLLRGDRESGVF